MSSRRALLVLLVAVGPIAIVASGEPKPKSPPVVAVVEEHFSKWNTTGDGKLTREQVDALVANHAIKGDAAAAAAALHLYFRGNPKAEPLTQAFITEAAARKLPDEERELANVVQHFQANYARFRQHIATAPREVFAGDAPKLIGMHQGALGDCFFVAVVGAAVDNDPKQVRSLFHSIKGGVCELSFPDGARTTVHLTDAQIALGSTASAQGLWLNVLEEAFGQVRFRQQGQSQGDIPIDTISRGGSANLSISLLTGHKSVQLNIPKHGMDEAANKHMRNVIVAGMRSRYLMSAGTPGPNCKLPPGMAHSHCYAVLGFDNAKDVVHLWNPWGNHFQPKKEPAGLENGYPVKDGLFDVPFAEFVRIFAYLDHELAEPASKKK